MVEVLESGDTRRRLRTALLAYCNDPLAVCPSLAASLDTNDVLGYDDVSSEGALCAVRSVRVVLV